MGRAHVQEPFCSADRTIERHSPMLNRPVNRLEAFRAEQGGEMRLRLERQSPDSIEAFLFPHALGNTPVWAPTLRTCRLRARIVNNHRPRNAANANARSCPHCPQRCWELSRIPSVVLHTKSPPRPLNRATKEIVGSLSDKTRSFQPRKS